MRQSWFHPKANDTAHHEKVLPLRAAPTLPLVRQAKLVVQSGSTAAAVSSSGERADLRGGLVCRASLVTKSW